MRKLISPLVTVFITSWVLIACNVSYDGCYQCERPSGSYWSSMGYITTYEATLGCSDDAAENLENDGWDCKGYPKTPYNPEPDSIYAGSRLVILAGPSDKALNVDLNVSLQWSPVINWYNNDFLELADTKFDVFLSSEDILSEPVSVDQTSSTYSANLAANTTYFWKVIAKNNKGEISESPIWSFTARKEFTLGTFTDTRDGHIYKTVSLYDHIWMAENLAYEIPDKQIIDITEWENNSTFDAWCYYNNDKETYGSTYGILYQLEAAENSCPEGWHLPKYTDFYDLTDLLYLNYAAGKLKEVGTSHWASPNTGATNETNFTALPGGYRDNIGVFNGLGLYGYWWSFGGQNFIIDYNYSAAGTSTRSKSHGYSVRCIKD